MSDRLVLAELLRRAAQQTISEADFWTKFRSLSDQLKEPVVEVARESATHYWGNFHERNILGFATKPDAGQLEQGKNELNLIAEGLDEGWELQTFKERLKNV